MFVSYYFYFRMQVKMKLLLLLLGVVTFADSGKKVKLITTVIEKG